MIIYFDFDGTIADTAEAIVGALASAFEAEGLKKPSPEAIRGKMGFPLRQIIRSAAQETLSDEAVEKIIIAYRQNYQNTPSGAIRLFKGMGEVVAKASAISEGMAIVTNKVTAGVVRDLRIVGLERYFGAVIGSDQVKNQKPAKDPLVKAREVLALEPSSKDVMIGDSSADMEMAHHEGLKTIGVSWGSKSAQTLKVAGAEAIADTPEALWEILQKIAHSNP